MAEKPSSLQAEKRRILLVGNSHAEVIARAHASLNGSRFFGLRAMLLHDPRYHPWGEWQDGAYKLNPIVKTDLTRAIRAKTLSHITMMIGGASHFELGGVNNPRLFDFIIPGREDLPLVSDAEIIPYDLVWQFFYHEEINILQPLFHAKSLMDSVSCLTAPPPVADPEKIVEHLPEEWVESAEALGVPAPIFRYKTWLVYTSVVKDICRDAAIDVLIAPPHTLDGNGFLKEEFSDDTLHGNAEYGEAVLEQIAALTDLREAAAA